MQLFVRSAGGRTVVLDATKDSTVCDIKHQLEARDSVPADIQFLRFGRHVLDDVMLLRDYGIEDGATLSSHMRLLGGAAQRAKEAAMAAAAKAAMLEEYDTWHKLADMTEESGVMRLLCVGMILEKDREVVQGKEGDPGWEAFFGCDSPSPKHYDNSGGLSRNGYALQENFDDEFKALFDAFVAEHWDMMKVQPEKLSQGKRIYLHQGFDDVVKVEVICGDDFTDGLWYKGPLQIVKCDADPDDEPVWDLEKLAKEKNMWVEFTDPSNNKVYRGFRHPWRIAGQYRELERWMHYGTGTTTYTLNAKGQLTLWSQEDVGGPLGLTDREKMRLRQMMQLTAKEAKGKALTLDELDLQKQVTKIVECGPCDNQQSGIFSWRIKSLKNLLENKCVFWTNSEEKLPCGSVADKSTTEAPKGGIASDGGGNEIIEFWKYEKKIGSIRKKYVMEDRQRLLDTIERFTPTYKAVIKNMGQDATDEGGDHYMLPEYQRKITNVVALALDMNMPDYDEDKIACFIKTLVEKRIGPTWHVLVGRSFGFSVQNEARHFLHLYMQHLAVVLWKSEPDPNAGKK